MRKHIPNFLTCLNLLCGCLALVYITAGLWNSQFYMASWFVIAACVFDFLDGMAARLLHAKSDIGKQLDSLADMVTFGLVPGFLLFTYIGRYSPEFNPDNFHGIPKILFTATPAFLFTICAALRLAKFNLNDEQSENFLGLPSPAAALVVISVPLIQHHNSLHIHLSTSNYYLLFFYSLTLILSLLMVSNIPLFGMKINSLSWKGNEFRYIFVALAIVSVIVLGYLGIPVAIALYLILSIIQNFTTQKDKPLQT